jgi:hypothetical protein
MDIVTVMEILTKMTDCISEHLMRIFTVKNKNFPHENIWESGDLASPFLTSSPDVGDNQPLAPADLLPG